MSTFNYSTGNPANLVGGSSANMADIKGPFDDLRTFINGQNLDYSNIAPVVDSYYKTIRDMMCQESGLTIGVVVLTNNSGIGQVATSSGAAGQAIFYLDPSHYPSGTRAAKLRLAANWATNNTAPAITYTYGLYPVTACTGTAGSNNVTLGAVVAGSTITNTTPAANVVAGHSETADFAFPSAGAYALGIAISGSEAANAAVIHRVALQFRAT